MRDLYLYRATCNKRADCSKGREREAHRRSLQPNKPRTAVQNVQSRAYNGGYVACHSVEVHESSDFVSYLSVMRAKRNMSEPNQTESKPEANLEPESKAEVEQQSSSSDTNQNSPNKKTDKNRARLYLSTQQRFWVLWYISRAQGMLDVPEDDIGFKVCRKARELIEANVERHQITRFLPNTSLKIILKHAHKSGTVEPTYKKTGRPKMMKCREKVKELLMDKDMSARSIARELRKASVPISRETVRRIAKDVMADPSTPRRK